MIFFRSSLCRLFATLLVLGAGSAAQAQIPLADQTISRHVHEAFRRDYRLRDSEITVATVGGVVTLTGTVSTYLDKHAAERIAERTIGVHSVVNRIGVDLIVNEDDKIRADVEQKLSRSRLVKVPGVRVGVDNGVVTLSGWVESWPTGQQAERIAREIPGVQSIKNDLRVTAPPTEVPDDQLRRDVESTFARDGYLGGYSIEIAVAGGVVTLTGEVPSLFLKRRAVTETLSVPGVRDVQDRLITDYQLTLQSLPKLRSEAELVQLVDRELTADPRIGINGIKIAVMHGEVALSGWVESIFAKRLAARIARQVLGVTDVHNQLEVRSGVRGDQMIRLELTEKLKSDHLLANADINVIVVDGTVTLSGKVSAHPHRSRATALASRVAGVRRIENELQVSPTPERSDDSLRGDIFKRLASNAITRDHAGQISVAVDDGVVTLSGKVKRYVVVLEILRIASRTNGVRGVENELQVARQ